MNASNTGRIGDVSIDPFDPSGNLFVDETITSAKDGDTYSMNELFLLYLNGNDEIGQNPALAFYWAKRMAEEDISSGMFNLALFYAKGFGTGR